MTREESLSLIISIYGLEHEVTISFATLYENLSVPDSVLVTLAIAHKEFPYCEE